MKIHLLSSDDYHTQRNNAQKPHYECGNTALANLICTTGYPEFIREYSGRLDDYFYMWLRQSLSMDFVDSINLPKWYKDHPEQSEKLLAFAASMVTGIAHIYDWKGTKEKLIKDIQGNKAVLCATDFYVDPKTGKAAKSGHWVIVSGLWEKGPIIDDSYGDPRTGYKVQNGYGLELEWNWFMERWADRICVYREG